MLRPEEVRELEGEVEAMPRKDAACIEALKVVQRHRGWVTDEGLRDVAGYLEMDPAQVESVATFYNLIFRKPVGRHVILMCDSVSCWMLGYDALRHRLTRELGIELGETTADDRFTLLPIPCLGNCDHAPALMVDEDLHQDLTPDDLPGILEDYE
ncbi:MAG: NADH-quinone oxidoreductase subunit NuoE [Gemmatimonadota bacterium]